MFKTGNTHAIRERDVEHVLALAREHSIDERVATALFAASPSPAFTNRGQVHAGICLRVHVGLRVYV